MKKECCIYLVACSADRIIGALLVTHDLRKGWLNHLAVRPAWQKMGVAKEPIERAEKMLRSIGVGIFAVQIQRP